MTEEGLSQEEAAHALDVTRGTIQRWLDIEARELPNGAAAMWCAGLMTVTWPEDFKPELVIATDRPVRSEMDRRLQVARRLIGRLELTLRTAEAMLPLPTDLPSDEKGTGLVDTKRDLPDDAAMNRTKRERRPGQQAKSTSFDWYDDDKALANRASKRLGMTVAQFIRYAVRRVGGEVETEKAG